MALEKVRHNHPVITTGVVGVAAVVVVVFALSSVAIVAGAVWTLVKLAFVGALILGLFHLARRALQHA
jgi:hypothetical protein